MNEIINTDVIEEYIGLLINALNGDVTAFVSLLHKVCKIPESARTIIFYDNFRKFLEGMQYDEDTQKKFLVFLNKDGKQSENSKRIVQLIEDMDSDLKISALINLTKSVSYNFISKRYYFRFALLLRNLISEDLEYLKENISSGPVKESDLIDIFLRNGLIYNSEDGEYYYSPMAFELDKFALSFRDEYKYKYNGEKDSIPTSFPPKYVGMVPYIIAGEIGEND